MIFALPAPIRLTHLGISSVPKALLEAGADTPAGMRSVPARVAEVVYAGPVTRVAADTEYGQRLTATLVSARTGADISHDAPVVLAWHDDAVRPLTQGAP